MITSDGYYSFDIVGSNSDDPGRLLIRIRKDPKEIEWGEWEDSWEEIIYINADSLANVLETHLLPDKVLKGRYLHQRLPIRRGELSKWVMAAEKIDIDESVYSDMKRALSRKPIEWDTEDEDATLDS